MFAIIRLYLEPAAVGIIGCIVLPRGLFGRLKDVVLNYSSKMDPSV